ncbi:MAG: hypothetical protein ACREID_10030, partial [Planctomycetota bacterium]
RAAARALAHFPDRRAVAALVEALRTETDDRTRLRIVETLRALTPGPCLLDAAEWTAWWSKNEGDPRFQPADEAARREAYEGIELETRTVAAVKSPRSKPRTFPHVLALPQFGWTTEEFGPYLLPLRANAAITWVRLPTVQSLTGRSGFGGDVPEYPVDRLVQALDAFRAARKVERFLVLAHGASGWIAMRYAQLHPGRCAALVLVDTALDRDAYAEALRRGAARGDEAERFAAKTLLHENNVPLDEATLERLQAMGVERCYHDRADLEIAHLFRFAREPQGFASVPPIRFAGRTTLELPALFVYSAGTPFSGHFDFERISRHFPRSMVAPIAEARGMPFVEANGKFHRVLESFAARFQLAE